MTFVQTFRPLSRANAIFFDISSIIIASLLIAHAAQVEIFLPFSPVPITGQSFAVLFLGMLLGSKRGALAVLAYLFEGSAGLPVFSGSSAGIAHLFGPTGGYLIGFVAAAYVTGFFAERGWDRKPLRSALAMMLGELAIYLFGLPWLGAFFGMDKVLMLGFLPFLPAAAIKISLAMMALPFAWKKIQK